MPNVRFNFRDSRGRNTSRTYWNTAVNDVAQTITDAGALALLLDPLTDLALVDITITYPGAASFAGAAVSNVDENVSVKVEGGDGRIYDVDIPDMPDAKMPTEVLDITDVDVVAFFNQFLVAGPWRVNLNNPTDIATVIRGTLDK